MTTRPRHHLVAGTAACRHGPRADRRSVRAVHRATLRAFTTLEVVATCAVIAALVTVGIVNVLPTAAQVADRAGPLTLATAALDARTAAEATHFTYDPHTLVPAMAALAGARTSAAGQVAYTTAPSAAPGPDRLDLQVSVAVVSPVQVALAVTTSDGPGGPSCAMAVDSLRGTTVHATLVPAVTGQGVNLCSGQVAAACAPAWTAAPGAGTARDPYRLDPADCT